MKKSIITILLFLFVYQSKAQETVLHLSDCYELAIKNYPLLKQKALYDKIEENRLNQLEKKFLPNLNLNLQASYQSDVTNLAIDETAAMAMGMQLPNISKDQYKANLDIQQLIWDGGLNREQKIIEQYNTQINKQNLDIELYKIKNSINQLFFSSLLIDKQLNTLKLSKNNLQNNIENLNYLVEQGMRLDRKSVV